MSEIDGEVGRAREDVAELAEKQRDEYHRAVSRDDGAVPQARARHPRLEVGAPAAERRPALPRRARDDARRSRARGDRSRVGAADQRSEVRAHTRRSRRGASRCPRICLRVEIEVLPPEVEQEGLDAFERIGEDVCETLERRPASLRRRASRFEPKFVPKDRERDARDRGPRRASRSELPIPRGLAGPGMLADTIVQRWQDHLPLNRLEGIYAREGLELARSTMCGWHVAARRARRSRWSRRCAHDALAQPYLCIDATGVLVQQARNAGRATSGSWSRRSVTCSSSTRRSTQRRRCRRRARRLPGLPRRRRALRLRPSLRRRRRRRGQLLGALPAGTSSRR